MELDEQEVSGEIASPLRVEEEEDDSGTLDEPVWKTIVR